MERSKGKESASFYFNEIAGNKVTIKDLGVLRAPHMRVGMDKVQAKSWLAKYLVDFANGSTIHGLKHITASRRHHFERFFLFYYNKIMFYWVFFCERKYICNIKSDKVLERNNNPSLRVVKLNIFKSV